MWDAGLKEVVVFIKQIFNVVQLKNVVINYNDHNPLCLFFPSISDRDGSEKKRRSERFHSVHNKPNVFLWVYFEPELVACLPTLGQQLPTLGQQLPLLGWRHEHLVIKAYTDLYTYTLLLLLR